MESFRFLTKLSDHQSDRGPAKKARAFRFRHSQSLARRRHRLSQAMVRSTIHRLGKTNEFACIRSLDNLDADRLADTLQAILELWSLIVAVGIKLEKERI